MSAHMLITFSSAWFVDLDSKIVTRVPRHENPDHPYVNYEKVGKPREFKTVKAIPDAGGVLYRFDEDEAYWFQTGHVIEGELPLEEESE